MIKKVTWVALFAFVLFVLTLECLVDAGRGHRLFTLAAHIPAGDKVGHMFLFGMLALLANTALNGSRFQWGSVTILKGNLFVLVPTILDEFSQLFFRSRTFDLLDLLAGCVGIFIGGCLALLLVRYLHLWTSKMSPVQSKAPLEIAPPVRLGE